MAYPQVPPYLPLQCVFQVNIVTADAVSGAFTYRLTSESTTVPAHPWNANSLVRNTLNTVTPRAGETGGMCIQLTPTGGLPAGIPVTLAQGTVRYGRGYGGTDYSTYTTYRVVVQSVISAYKFVGYLESAGPRGQLYTIDLHDAGCAWSRYPETNIRVAAGSAGQVALHDAFCTAQGLDAALKWPDNLPAHYPHALIVQVIGELRVPIVIKLVIDPVTLALVPYADGNGNVPAFKLPEGMGHLEGFDPDNPNPQHVTATNACHNGVHFP